MMELIINKAFEVVNFLWPWFEMIFTLLAIWLAIGLVSWIITMSLGFVWHDFLTGFHDFHEIIFFGPFGLAMAIYLLFETLKGNREYERRLSDKENNTP